jgi:predicted flap endonuclease-1-like 5' DNA nuclease
MSVAKTMFAITFVLFLGITLIVPSFPPVQLIMPQTMLSNWSIPVATLLVGITNGLFWTIIVVLTYGLAQLALRTGRPGLLPPMPVAPYLITPPPENQLVDSRVGLIPPALTIPPGGSPFKVGKEPVRAMMRTESDPIRFSREPIGAEVDVETFEGIGLVCGGLLRNLGIDTVSDLLKVSVTERGRRRLASEIGVTYSTLLKWVHREDLLRVKGIGRKYSTLLESAGVNTATDLKEKNPDHLCQTLRALNRERHLVMRSPPSKTIELWVHNAKTLNQY